MNSANLKKNFIKKKISKSQFINKMFNNYLILENIKKLLKNDGINKISINNKEIIFNYQNRFHFVMDKLDKRAFPIEFMNFGNYEKNCVNFFKKIIKNQRVVFDVGANIGFYSMLFEKINSKIEIFSFEPVKETFIKLKKNIKYNNLRTKIYNFGFHDKKGIKNIFFDKLNSAAASLKNTQGTKNRVKIKLNTIDYFVLNKKISRLDFIKCDVEGAEYFVIKGAQKTIRKFKPILFFEILRKFCKLYKYSPNQILFNLRSHGYRCFEIKNDYIKEINKITDKTISTNFLFLHSLQHLKLIKKFCK